MKQIFLILLMSMLNSCIGYNTHINKDTVYKINNVNIKLKQKCLNKNLSTEEELTRIFKDKIKEKFCKLKKCIDYDDQQVNNVVNLEFNISYWRINAGEELFCNEIYAQSRMAFDNYAKINNIIIAKDHMGGETLIFGNPFRMLYTISIGLFIRQNKALDNKNIDTTVKHVVNGMLDKLKLKY